MVNLNRALEGLHLTSQLRQIVSDMSLLKHRPGFQVADQVIQAYIVQCLELTRLPNEDAPPIRSSEPGDDSGGYIRSPVHRLPTPMSDPDELLRSLERVHPYDGIGLAIDPAELLQRLHIGEDELLQNLNRAVLQREASELESSSNPVGGRRSEMAESSWQQVWHTFS